MPKLIDHDRIATMARTGCSEEIIAKRLQISERTVRRVLAVRGLTIQPNSLIGTDDEWRLWELYKAWREKPSKIAYRFGYSRQHLYDYFSQPRQIEGEPVETTRFSHT